MTKYWLFEKGDVVGPFTMQELKNKEGFTPDMLVSPEGVADDHMQWKPVSSFKEYSSPVQQNTLQNTAPKKEELTVPPDISVEEYFRDFYEKESAGLSDVLGIPKDLANSDMYLGRFLQENIIAPASKNKHVEVRQIPLGGPPPETYEAYKALKQKSQEDEHDKTISSKIIPGKNIKKKDTSLEETVKLSNVKEELLALEKAQKAASEDAPKTEQKTEETAEKNIDQNTKKPASAEKKAENSAEKKKKISPDLQKTEASQDTAQEAPPPQAAPAPQADLAATPQDTSAAAPQRAGAPAEQNFEEIPVTQAPKTKTLPQKQQEQPKTLENVEKKLEQAEIPAANEDFSAPRKKENDYNTIDFEIERRRITGAPVFAPGPRKRRKSFLFYLSILIIIFCIIFAVVYTVPGLVDRGAPATDAPAPSTGASAPTASPAPETARPAKALVTPPSKPAPAALPVVLPLSEEEKNAQAAIEIAKNYNLSSGRGVLGEYFEAYFKNYFEQGYSASWSAEHLYRDSYIVKYRLTKPRKEPVVYIFETDLNKKTIVGALNNVAMDLLDL